MGTITRRHVDATRTISAQASTGHHRCGSVYPHDAREELTPQGVLVVSRRLRGGPGVERLSAAVGHESLSHPSDLLVGTVMWAPFALVFAMNVAGRAALVTPIELRANWIFRVTENEVTRAEEVNAVARTLVAWGVVVPLTVLLPLACTVLRWRAVPCTSIAALGGLLLVELQMMEWRWIPFTCWSELSTQAAGKRLLAGGAAYLAFTTLGPRLAGCSCVHPAAWVIVLLVLGALLLYLRRQRLWLSRRAALMFEELVPNEIEPLKLKVLTERLTMRICGNASGHVVALAIRSDGRSACNDVGLLRFCARMPPLGNRRWLRRS